MKFERLEYNMISQIKLSSVIYIKSFPVTNLIQTNY